VRLDRELRNTIHRIAAEESAVTKEEISVAPIIRQALRDFAARRLSGTRAKPKRPEITASTATAAARGLPLEPKSRGSLQQNMTQVCHFVTCKLLRFQRSGIHSR